MWLDFSCKKNYNTCSISNNWKNSILEFLRNWNDNTSTIVTSTSGTTTGIPKKIFLKKEYMYRRATITVDFLKLNKKKIKGFLCLPINYIAAKMFLIRAIIFQWKVYCIKPTSNPLKNIKEYFDISSMIPIQVSFGIKNINYIKTILIGGTFISKSLEVKLQKVITNCYVTYGMTETAGHIALRKINGLDRNRYYKSFYDVIIFSDKRNCLNIYTSINSLIVTNDIVDIKSKNTFIWIGRYDNIINSGGIKIIPELIEKYISIYIPYNKRFFISSIPDDMFGEKIILVIEGNPFTLKIPNYIFFGEKKYFKPKKIFFITNFIENSFGKVKKKEIVKHIIMKK
ncbi:acyl-CoA synthetase family protein [Blattabacterium cuenoti]|uniref:o-succinylbenzoate--CoA ligase n=1 Tax=Blattabacterium cuenoti TaxID=1653831 RepID=UPI00163CD885|nr:o-succinylbenzoate--CoA ligase [Blattabacterium cuenoti]